MLQAKKSKIVTKSTIKDSDIYKLLIKIPAGNVSTYGDLAKALGNPSASREIGRILGKNPNPIVVPCHRVVRSDGKLGGYAYGSTRKRELLEKEWIPFTDEIRDFKEVRVYPLMSNTAVRNSWTPVEFYNTHYPFLIGSLIIFNV
jgi:methylated-DNA-[protein]-cysteine S-methyltransferase